jgi:adenylate cyclase
MDLLRKASALDGLPYWLAGNAAAPLPELHAGFCRELVGLGFPLWRSSLGLELLHPEQSGVRLIWSLDREPRIDTAPRGIEDTPAYLSSPVKIVDDTDRPFRRRLTEPNPDLPILEELRAEGATDYIIFPLPFLDRTRSTYLSFVTKGPEGFAEPQLELLETSSKLISPYAERRALRRMAIDLLDTYVGHHAGERVFSGQVRRGAVDSIQAAILMADLRGFTALSKLRERDVVIETLNLWFDSITTAIEAEDGEVLKFMGDGLLAIFRAEAGVADACRRAYKAASAAAAVIKEHNSTRGNGGAPIIEFAVGLHVGEVAYGNVGGRRRLDFTVLGPAVNYASRLQDLAKRLNQPMLASREFAEALHQDVPELGSYPLRGIGASERVFALPLEAPAAAST